jgi:hypothetical protein
MNEREWTVGVEDGVLPRATAAHLHGAGRCSLGSSGLDGRRHSIAVGRRDPPINHFCRGPKHHRVERRVSPTSWDVEEGLASA